uniref:Thioredoxin-T n=1 Tax=Schistocephalus solidus TaxID=70667 RepID=A0A0X3NRM5_SCHSO
MSPLYEVDMCLDECLISAKARLVMVAFVDLKDEDNAEVMKLLEGISHEHKRLVILVVNARKNLGLVQQFNIVACPTFVFFRSRQLLGSRVTTKEEKLRKDIEKYSQIFVTCPQH